MHLRQSVKDIAVGAGLAAIVSGAVLMAQVGTGPAKGTRQPDPGEPCCAITNIDAAKGVLTAKVKATGKTFTINDIPAVSLAKFTVGGTLDLACAVPPNSATSGSGTTGVTGNAACGSNVPRNADTRPKDCVATNSAGQEIKIACPQNVPIKSSK